MDFENVEHLRAATQQIRKLHELTVKSTSVSAQQAATMREKPVRGAMWVSKMSIPAPREDTSRKLLLDLVDELNEKNVSYDRPASETLRCEWVGYRKGVGKDEPEPDIDQEEKFRRLKAETTSPLTVFYIYGGSFGLNIPSNYRRMVANLSHKTGSKTILTTQRLAPQNPFPAALLDIFQTYLSLISPPPNSFHQPIHPSNVVFAGDSSGACLALGLLQTLLRLREKGTPIIFHGKKINPEILIPAGLALLSPAVELTDSSPSWTRNARNDYLLVDFSTSPYLSPSLPRCSAWPTTPPRAYAYTETLLLTHPLVSPGIATSWAGACPIWLASGEEQSADAVRLLAQTASSHGVSVRLAEYEACPHDFFFLWREAPQSKKVLREWAEVVKRMGEGGRMETGAVMVLAKGLREVDIKVGLGGLVGWDVETAKERMTRAARRYLVPKHFYEERSVL